MKLEKCRSYRQRQQENSLLTGRGGVYVDDSNVYINIAVNGFVKKQDPWFLYLKQEAAYLRQAISPHITSGALPGFKS